MGAAFSAARTVLFRDPNGSEEGTLLPAAGGSYPCRIILIRPDDPLSIGPNTGARNQGIKIQVERTSLPLQVLQNDHIVARGITHRVRDVEAEVRDQWDTCDVDPE